MIVTVIGSVFYYALPVTVIVIGRAFL